MFILAAAIIILAAVTPGMKAQAANTSLPDKTPLWFDAEYYCGLRRFIKIPELKAGHFEHYNVFGGELV